jgi:hypothetical protein
MLKSVTKLAASKLAPQNTSTNDLKDVLVLKAKDGEDLTLNPRKVIARGSSVSPKENMTK